MDDDFLHDLFRDFGTIEIKRMFSGRGIYARGVIFAIISRDGAIHLKTDETTRQAFEREGTKPLSFTKKNGQHMVTSYWRLPERLYDDPEELAAWTRDAVRVAQAKEAAAKKPAVKKAVKTVIARKGTPKAKPTAKPKIKPKTKSKARKKTKAKTVKRRVKRAVKRR